MGPDEDHPFTLAGALNGMHGVSRHVRATRLATHMCAGQGEAGSGPKMGG